MKDTVIDFLIAFALIAILVAIVVLSPVIIDAAYKASTPLVKAIQ